MTRRRGHGEGSVFQRKDGLWSAVIDLGRDGEGKRLRRTIYGRTRKEVTGKLQAAQAEIQTTGALSTPTKTTLGTWLEEWLAAAADTVRPATLESYRQFVRVHILPSLGGVALSKVQPTQIQNLYASMRSAGKSKRTVQYVHAILRRALNQAVKLGLLSKSPAAAVDAPRPDRREMTVLTPAQVEQLVAAMAGDPLAPLYYLLIATGARRGEICALRWSDINWDRSTIQINRTAEIVSGRVVFTEPKTPRSRRLIPLPGEAVEVLLAQRDQQAADQGQAGELFRDQGLVFARPTGDPISPGHVTQHFALILKKAQLPHVRLHDLRHTHATMLLAAGVHPKIVSERLGHSSVVMTLDTYSHVLPTMQEEVTRKLDALLPGARTAKTKGV